MNTAFQRTAASDEWYTPKEIIDSLGVFELDPCAPMKPLWKTAERMVNKEEDGLKIAWGGYAYGAIHLTPSRSSRSSARRWWRTATACFSPSPGRTTSSFRNSFSRSATQSFFSARGYDSTLRTERGEGHRAAEAFFLLSEKGMCRPWPNADSKDTFSLTPTNQEE